MVGRSFVSDGISGLGCGEGIVGGSYWALLLKVIALTFYLGFYSACEGSLPIFWVSILLRDVAIFPIVFSRFFNEA